jgi:ElaB/YqjD/DUF883 family membrane-anchored ribosome-binding protein
VAQRDQGDPAAGRTGGRDRPGGALIRREDSGEPDTQALRTDIEAARNQIAETFDSIQDQLEEQTGWKTLTNLRKQAHKAQYQSFEALGELKTYTRSPGEATQWVREHPVEALVLAFGLGVVIGIRPFR